MTKTKKIIIEFKEMLKQIMLKIILIDIKEKIKIINYMKKELNKYSLFKDPVDIVQWIPFEKIYANDYNPNNVAPPEMKLLTLSIDLDGFTQPIVAYKDGNKYEVIDGFHRFLVGSKNKKIKTKIKGHLPLVIIDKPISERIASTIRHNRARGKHAVKPMSDIVADLIKNDWKNERIAKELGMQADEILRLKQRTGLPDIYKDKEFSKAWVEEKLFAPFKELKSLTPDQFDDLK